MKKLSQTVTVSIPEGTGKSMRDYQQNAVDDAACRFFGLAPPPQQHEMDFSKLEERTLSFYTGLRHVPIGVISSRAMAGQFFGRSCRNGTTATVERKSKAQRKLDAADYELKKIKANFELEASLAYRSFLAGIVHNPELCAVATNLPSHVGRSWYKELLADLGCAPHQLKLPTPEAK